MTRPALIFRTILRTTLLLLSAAVCLPLCAIAQERSSGVANVKEADNQTTYERRFTTMKGMMEGALSQLGKIQYCHDRQLFYHTPTGAQPNGYCMNPISADVVAVP